MRIFTLFILFMCLIISCNKEASINKNVNNKTIDSLKTELANSKSKIELLKKEIAIKREARKKYQVIYNNEKFSSFFWSFMTDSTFQLERINFPLEYITWKDELGEDIDTIKLTKEHWKYNSFYINNASERTQIYDNFDLNLRPTNERVIHWYGVETGGDSKYYFSGKNGKWYLIKKEQLGD